MNISTPRVIFIVPYRNRVHQKHFFVTYMQHVMSVDFEPGSYEIYFVHQADSREFNRGAMKNIGVFAIKQKYPHTFNNITVVFHDVDTIPYAPGVVQYETDHGVVRHHYGFRYALGGIVSFRIADFEAVNGFPNLFGWGQEDSMLYDRCLRQRLYVDRSQFYLLGDLSILHLFDNMKKVINECADPTFMATKGMSTHAHDGIHTLYNVQFTIDKQSSNPSDADVATDAIDNVFFVNVTDFITSVPYMPNLNQVYDIRDDIRKSYRKVTLPQQQHHLHTTNTTAAKRQTTAGQFKFQFHK